MIPYITVFSRHSAECLSAGNELHVGCNCRKHVRWQDPTTKKQLRKKTGTRSAEEADKFKAALGKELGGGSPVDDKEVKGTMLISEARDLYIETKGIANLAETTMGAHRTYLNYLLKYASSKAVCQARPNNLPVLTLSGLTGEFMIRFAATWKDKWPSGLSRKTARARYSGFLKFCFDQGWIERRPVIPGVGDVDEAPTLPLKKEEEERLFASIPSTHKTDYVQKRVRSLFLLQRWSGLAIVDALTLAKSDIVFDGENYRVVTRRIKTDVDVSVLIEEDVAKEILSTPNDNPKYIFWNGTCKKTNFAKHFGHRLVLPVFKTAGIAGDCSAKSHRWRDTFAVNLLQNGVPLEFVSKALGHDTIATTEKSYAKWVKGRQDLLDQHIKDSRNKGEPGSEMIPQRILRLQLAGAGLGAEQINAIIFNCLRKAA